MSMALGADRRYNFFFSPPAHLYAVTCVTEISLIVTLNNQFTTSHHDSTAVTLNMQLKKSNLYSDDRGKRDKHSDLSDNCVFVFWKIELEMTIPLLQNWVNL